VFAAQTAHCVRKRTDPVPQTQLGRRTEMLLPLDGRTKGVFNVQLWQAPTS
jgi:hypothetical protein